MTGSIVTIRPAYNSETHERDIWDDWTGCEAVVVEVRPGDMLVLRVPSGAEVEMHVQRCKFRRPE